MENSSVQSMSIENDNDSFKTEMIDEIKKIREELNKLKSIKKNISKKSTKKRAVKRKPARKSVKTKVVKRKPARGNKSKRKTRV